jgi:hypothetical protein
MLKNAGFKKIIKALESFKNSWKTLKAYIKLLELLENYKKL